MGWGGAHLEGGKGVPAAVEVVRAVWPAATVVAHWVGIEATPLRIRRVWCVSVSVVTEVGWDLNTAQARGALGSAAAHGRVHAQAVHDGGQTNSWSKAFRVPRRRHSRNHCTAWVRTRGRRCLDTASTAFRTPVLVHSRVGDCRIERLAQPPWLIAVVRILFVMSFFLFLQWVSFLVEPGNSSRNT